MDSGKARSKMSVGIRVAVVLDSGKVRSKRGVGGYSCGSGS